MKKTAAMAVVPSALAPAGSSLGRTTLIITALLGAAFSAMDAVGQSTYVLTTGRRLPYLYAISLDAALDPANDNTSNAIVSRSKVASEPVNDNGTLFGIN